MKNITDKKYFRAWLIVVGCMLMQAVPFAVALNIQPQFISYVIEENKGFTLSGFSLIFTIGAIASGLSSPIIGNLYTKVSAKYLFLSGALLSGGSFAMFSLASELWHFYLIQTICQIGTAIFSSIGIPLMITAWFDEGQKGKALGLAFAGGSIGNIFLQTLTVMFLESIGVSQSYALFGILSLIVGIPVSLFIIRMPTSDEEKVKSDSKLKNKTNDGVTFKEVLKLKQFWIISIGFVFMGLYIATNTIQYPTYIKSIENLAESDKIAGFVGSTLAIFALVGNLLGGGLYDKIGIKKSLLIASILSILSIISLLLIPIYGSIFCYAFSVLQGLSVFAYMISPSYIVGSFFGNKDFGTILGVIQIFFAIGFAFGSVIFATLVESFGYNMGWGMTMVFAIAAYSLLIIGVKSSDKLDRKV